jgi:cyclic pyranopterin phosphate synthase
VKLSHVDAAGRARMVDVGDKPITVRTAVAEGEIRMTPAAFRLVAEGEAAKGDVLAVSELAGTQAAKRTAELIPLCHPVGLDHIEVRASLDAGLPGVRIRVAAKAVGRPVDGNRRGAVDGKDRWYPRGLAARRRRLTRG